MGKGTKAKKIPGEMRAVLAANIRRLRDHHFKELPNRDKALAKEAGMSLSNVQRILDQSQGASIDKIEGLAAAFELSPYQLLVPGLDPGNPQVLREATETEKRLWAKLRTAEEKLANYEEGSPPGQHKGRKR